MKIRSFIDSLKKQGVTVENKKKHYALYFQDEWTICPRHPSKEISEDFIKGIRKQLGLK